LWVATAMLPRGAEPRFAGSEKVAGKEGGIR
jgi:hypothetical protein